MSPIPRGLFFILSPEPRAPLRSLPPVAFVSPSVSAAPRHETLVPPYAQLPSLRTRSDYRRDFLLYDLLRLSEELSRPLVDKKLPDMSSTILVKFLPLSLCVLLIFFVSRSYFSCD